MYRCVQVCHPDEECRQLDGVKTLHLLYLETCGLTVNDVAFFKRKLSESSVFFIDENNQRCVCYGSHANVRDAHCALAQVDDRAADCCLLGSTIFDSEFNLVETICASLANGGSVYLVSKIN